ncbi:MAG TPA: LamG-like jellyroll fold domain-containing protein, partial [Iamia sp.]
NTNRVFSSATNNPITISDVDAGGATVEVQLTATNGTVTLPVLTGLTFTAGDGTADATMTFRGTIVDINLRLSGAWFTPTTSFTGAASLQVVGRDLGNVGSGGALSDTDSIAITVNALGIFTANQDIGIPPGIAGSSSYSGGTYTVAGSGADIWDNADHFQFAHVPMTGDGRLTARVVSQVQSPAPASAPAKAGVMFRQSLAAGSIHGMADIMQANGSEFHWRLTTDGPSGATTVTAGLAAPYWVRITRVGNLVTAERSVNGTTWVQQGSSQTITMGSTIYAGLAVSAVNTAKLNTATFDNVSLTTPPTAVADSYRTNEDTTLVLAAPGVLANDTDPESGALTAVLESGTPGLTLNANGSFTYVPPANASGPVSFTYRASDGVFTSSPITVTVTVRPANETPSFTKGADQSVTHGSDAQSVPGWATAISPGTGESGQLVEFVVTNDSPALFDVQPALSPTGTLTYTPGDTNGVVTVTVRLQDNGGTTNGATDISPPQTFTISITDDVHGPTGGSVDAAGLVGTGGRYATSTTLSIVLAKGTDPSGVAATGAQLTRATAALTSGGGTADGACGTFGSYSPVTGGTDPASPKADTVGDQACYRYRYLVVDTLGNPTTYTSPDVKVDLTAPSAPALGHSAFTNTYWSGSGSTVHYRPGAATGSFTVTASATDAASGVASYAFPALGSGWTSTPGALGVHTYSWSSAPSAPGTSQITATNHASVSGAGTGFTLTADSTAPAGASVTYSGGMTSNTSVSVTTSAGTDSGSGVGTRLLQRASATLTGTTCGTYGSFATVANGTNPTSPLVDTVGAGSCYKYQLVVSDNVGNQSTAPNSAEVKVTQPYATAVSGTTGLLSYWRLGETTSTTVSSDSFTGTAGALLTSRAGEVGATWAFQGGSANTEQLSDAGRARRNGTGYAVTYTTATPPSADYSVEADLHVRSNLVGDRVGLVGRLNTATNSYYMARWEPEDTSWNLMEVTNGSPAYLQFVASQPALVVGQTHRLKLTMTGSTLQLFVNGALTVTATDATITAAGKAGLMDGEVGGTANKTNTTGIHYDNFLVTAGGSTTMADSKGTNHGTYVNGPTLGQTGALNGDANTAASFDGVNDHATAARQISGDFSIEVWFKTTQVFSNDFGQPHCTQWWQGAGLVDADTSGSANDFGLSVCDGKVIGGTGVPEISAVSPATYNDGAWHHVVFTRTQSSGAMVLYVDGVQVGTATGPTTALTSTPTLNIGRMAPGVSHFAGTIDEVAVYTTVLSAATVATHHGAAH